MELGRIRGPGLPDLDVIPWHTDDTLHIVYDGVLLILAPTVRAYTLVCLPVALPAALALVPIDEDGNVYEYDYMEDALIKINAEAFNAEGFTLKFDENSQMCTEELIFASEGSVGI